MAKRDPNKTARNRTLKDLRARRRILQPKVFQELRDVAAGRYCNEMSLNAFIGSKTDDYLNLRDDVIKSASEYTSRWVSGLKKAAARSEASSADPRHMRMRDLVLGDYPNFKRYLGFFLQGSFLRRYEVHYKVKPKIDESALWFGNNHDEFGLLVTPRFAAGQWENDKSEVRHFRHPYWTISHVLETGLCYMNENRRRTFSKTSDYLQFFRDLVRRTGSSYQISIADNYIALVEEHDNPLAVPLLIPELRYDPLRAKHRHRLDFLVINPWTMDKVGFEISPWSTHGKLTGAGRKMAEYDKEAKANFEKEMRKQKRYWRKYGIACVVYTDEDLADMTEVWNEIRAHVDSPQPEEQLELALMLELS